VINGTLATSARLVGTAISIADYAIYVISLLLGGSSWPGVLTPLPGASVAWARIFLGVHFPLDMFALQRWPTSLTC
jgi:membrane-associated phospholipid phosphatase